MSKLRSIMAATLKSVILFLESDYAVGSYYNCHKLN